MIAVDTSALMAILQGEPEANACKARLALETDILISAATIVEALIVSGWRNAGPAMAGLIEGAGMEIVPVTPAAAHRIGAVYSRWGKGVHPAGLNFGDCFAYDVAKQNDCPLLFVGDDFAKTDLLRAINNF
jgi:ribonuclease VapC